MVNPRHYYAHKFIICPKKVPSGILLLLTMVKTIWACYFYPTVNTNVNLEFRAHTLLCCFAAIVRIFAMCAPLHGLHVILPWANGKADRLAGRAWGEEFSQVRNQTNAIRFRQAGNIQVTTSTGSIAGWIMKRLPEIIMTERETPALQKATQRQILAVLVWW